MFVFMANHEIVATHSKPRHLVKRFYLVISKIIGGKMYNRSNNGKKNLLGCWDTSLQVCVRGKTTLHGQKQNKNIKLIFRATKLNLLYE